MRSATRAGVRIIGIGALALLIAHCGDSSVHITTGHGVNPAAGTFTGTTDEGGTITVVVDSIRSITFECDSDDISQTFDPPKQIDGGAFSVKFKDAGRDFRVTGTFTDQNTLEGFIDDEDNHCASRPNAAACPRLLPGRLPLAAASRSRRPASNRRRRVKVPKLRLRRRRAHRRSVLLRP